MIREPPQGLSPGKIRELEKSIEVYIREKGYHVGDNRQLAEEWKNEAQSEKGFYDPVSGQLDWPKIHACLMKAIERVNEKQNIDAVIFIQVVSRPARLMGDRVYWDGCSKKVYDDNGDEVLEVNWRGEIEGLSLRVQIFNRDRLLLFENIGALEFPYILHNSYQDINLKWKDTLRFDSNEIKEGMAIAFHPFIQDIRFPKHPKFYGN
jgi:hypothetical protein